MLQVAVTNLKKYRSGVLCCYWLQLPADDAEIEKAYNAIGTNKEDEIFLSDYESDIQGLYIDSYENLEDINDLFFIVSTLEDYEVIAYKAAVATGLNIWDALQAAVLTL